MEIIVCIKQVPGSTDIKIDPEKHTLIRDSADAIINPFDLHAIEAGVLLKEQNGGTVTALSMGPPQAKDALSQAIAVGVDQGILLSDKAFAGADTLATSYTLAASIKKTGAYDLIICGKQTMDGDTGQVGPEIAYHLDIPCVTYVRKIVKIDKSKIVLERLVEEGFEVVESPLPVVISVVREINEPRMPSLRGMMAAKKAEIPVWTVDDIDINKQQIGMDGSPTWVVKTFVPKREKKNEILSGEADSQVEQLISKLRGGKTI